jgi:hypothetical protein
MAAAGVWKFCKPDGAAMPGNAQGVGRLAVIRDRHKIPDPVSKTAKSDERTGCIVLWPGGP